LKFENSIFHKKHVIKNYCILWTK